MSQCPRPVDTAIPARFVFAACRPGLARNARTYEIALSVPDGEPDRGAPRRDEGSPDELRSGRALLTGFVGGPAPWTTGRSSTSPDFVASERPRRTFTTTAPPRSRRWSTTTSSSSSSWRRMPRRGPQSHQSRRPTACTSIGDQRPRSALRSLRICESCSYAPMASRRVVQSLDGYVDHMASAPSPTLFRHFAAGVGKRRTPGGQLVEHRSHRKESRPRVDDAVARLFGRHLHHRAHDLPASVALELVAVPEETGSASPVRNPTPSRSHRA